MTTNKEYLQSLEPRELSAWFDSEHTTQETTELKAQINRLTRERDNLADDLLESNREREHLRKSLGIAIDRAHDICELVNLDEGLA